MSQTVEVERRTQAGAACGAPERKVARPPMPRRIPRLPLAAVALAALVALASPVESHAAHKAGPRVTRVVVHKGTHRLELFAGEQLVGAYAVAIGPGGAGPKLREGDKVTPVGRYHVIRHQPSQFKVFLRLDYPNATDRARFARLKREGALPREATIGGDIGIHGPPVTLAPAVKPLLKMTDWTLGCIAVDDDEISEIAARVPDGTVVDIED